MESQGEELGILSTEVASLKELLANTNAQMTSAAACNAALLACKDELLASRSAELQHCHQLLLGRTTRSELDAAAADSSKRQRLHSSTDAESPLERDDLLDDVFSYVGGGDHLYTGGVCRRWRGLYLSHCINSTSNELDKKFVTRNRSALMTESRLQLALSSGLSIEGWRFATWQSADLICKHSLEPERVVALLRVHGMTWCIELCNSAAYFNKLALLQWLHSHSCPWEADSVLHHASVYGSVAMLEWLFTVTAPWTSDDLHDMFQGAGCYSNIPAAQWLRAHGAVWPDSFSPSVRSKGLLFRVCWDIPAVHWAVTSGSGWLDWKCEDYAADNYVHAHFKKQAAELLEWAHVIGCPCTCGHVQQQQQ
jgi:hypothetical protein